MAQVSKNARTGSATQKFFCPCGGEVKMKSVIEKGRKRNVAQCEKCSKAERKPSDFR
jgi:transcription elongation factor Elf1